MAALPVVLLSKIVAMMSHQGSSFRTSGSFLLRLDAAEGERDLTLYQDGFHHIKSGLHVNASVIMDCDIYEPQARVWYSDGMIKWLRTLVGRLCRFPAGLSVFLSRNSVGAIRCCRVPFSFILPLLRNRRHLSNICLNFGFCTARLHPRIRVSASKLWSVILDG